MESGLGDSFLSKDINAVITDGWIKSLWEFLSLYNITITRVDWKIKHHLRHERDIFLMEAVAEKGQDVTKRDRILFNLCRMYLQVKLFMDIGYFNSRRRFCSKTLLERTTTG